MSAQGCPCDGQTGMPDVQEAREIYESHYGAPCELREGASGAGSFYLLYMAGEGEAQPAFVVSRLS